MGNQLMGVAASQIYPVEHYLTGSFEPHLQFDVSMGSTRFFKVARAKSEEGTAVVKVFVIHDVTLSLDGYDKRLEYIKKNLSNAVNCLPFQRFLVTEKAAFIVREYVKHSLYDKVSTRPFLTILEKRWITFQILCALHQCHKQKICHGDIKLENILITSWNWILLSDFASFKPTFLPNDNPAEYTYFFDTSRRRTCYIAPERFVNASSNKETAAKQVPAEAPGAQMSDSIINNTVVLKGPNGATELLPEMDIFSTGCALLELWSEGKAPFELSQLLAYRMDDMELVKKHLKGVENDNLHEMIESMISLDPADRRSAEIYLDQERGRLFPEYFYTFLQSYMQMFSSIPIMSPDDKITRLHKDISTIVEVLCNQPNDWKRSGEDELSGGTAEKTSPLTTNEGLIIITTVVTSCIRGLKHCITKLRCLEIMHVLAQHSDSETILDRILPFILHLTNDPTARVRVVALDTLTECLLHVTEVKRRDANVFPEYVLPSIAALATDSSLVVRIAYAKNIAVLAETSVRFLEQTQHFSDAEKQAVRFETEMGALHEMLQQTVSYLLTDSHAIVKQTLIESGIIKLCQFFGRQKANDLILSHMITFLNDKEDTNLRGSFFDCIVGVAAYVGWHCSEILVPLLQQGLTDLDEFVVVKSIAATAALCEMGLIRKTALTAFIAECATYLNHPNLWIRHETCGLLAATTKTLSAIDVQCKVLPAISMHLQSPVLQLERPEILMNNLNAPIPRAIFDSVIRFADILQLMRVLEERQADREAMVKGALPQGRQMTMTLVNFFRRLTSELLTERVEKQLLSMKTYLLKLNKYKAAESRDAPDGKIVLEKRPSVCHEYMMTDKTNQRKSRKSEHDANTVSSEWLHMFEHQVAGAKLSNDSAMSSGMLHSPSMSSANQIPLSSLVEYSMAERSFMQERSSECRQTLESLRHNIKMQYQILAATRDFRSIKEQQALPDGWRIKGNLVAHLHEHKSGVTKLVNFPLVSSTSHVAATASASPFFASCSTDGTVRLWDCTKLDGTQSINRSCQMYSAGVPLYSMAACAAGRSLAVAGKDGSLMLLRIDSNSSKMALQEAHHLDVTQSSGSGPLEDGPVVDMQPLAHGSNSLMVYATLYGSLVCWDLRMAGSAWKLKTDLKCGVITSICTDTTGCWLSTGTSSGKLVNWDLRFGLSISTICHPLENRIRKVVAHPTEHSKIMAAVAGSNEVSIWDIETSHRQGALWASSSPPLTNHGNNSNTTVCGMVAGTVNRTPFIFTAGTDQRIRYWDLSALERSISNMNEARVQYMCAPTNCTVVVPAAREAMPDVSYDSRLIDGTAVIYEISPNNTTNHSASSTAAASSNNASGSSSSATGGSASSGLGGGGRSGSVEEQQPRSGPELPAAGHNDVITEMLLCQSSKQQTFLASASRDGIIKLWK